MLAGPAGWGPALDTAGLGPSDVRQLGYLDGPTLRSVVAHAAALCFPSIDEGFGLPPLEALAAGTPVVASDLPVLREVLAAAGTAVRFFPPRDADALAEAISSTLAAPRDPAAGGRARPPVHLGTHRVAHRNGLSGRRFLTTVFPLFRAV